MGAATDAPMNADEVVELLGLEPLAGEGGMWVQTYRDQDSSAIYYLLKRGDFSALHRLGGTEIWHHYAGAAVEIFLLGPTTGQVQRRLLGDDLAEGERPVAVVGAGTWMAAASTGDWSLMGTTMSPPFSEATFELGDRATLTAQFPDAAAEIFRFTRADDASDPR